VGVPEGVERMLTKADEDAEPELEPGLAGAGVPAPPAEAEPGIRSGGSRGSNAAPGASSPAAVRSRTSSRSADAAPAKPWSVRNAMTWSSPGAAMRLPRRARAVGGVGLGGLAQARGRRRGEVSGCVAIGREEGLGSEARRQGESSSERTGRDGRGGAKKSEERERGGEAHGIAPAARPHKKVAAVASQQAVGACVDTETHIRQAVQYSLAHQILSPPGNTNFVIILWNLKVCCI
jgi:hypothetical protein